MKRVEIGRIDFLKDAADLQVFYDPPRPRPAPAGTATVADAGNAPDARVTFNPKSALAPSATDTP